MQNLIKQLKKLKITRYEIRLQALENASLNALIGSALRGAFGHSLKKVACSVQHRECERCILNTACVYPRIFEPSSSRLKNAPRPFVFEPPIPPFTKEISKNKSLILGVEKGEQISFGLTIIGEAQKDLPYFIYAAELFAEKGLGVKRTPFKVSNVCVKDIEEDRYRIYEPSLNYIEPHEEFQYNLSDLLMKYLDNFNYRNEILKIRFLTPLRIMQNRRIITKITFRDIFKQASLRIKHLTDIYGKSLEYDYKYLMDKAGEVKIIEENTWRHNSERWTNRQNRKLKLDGILGEMEFVSDNFEDFLPILIAGEILNIGSSTSFGFGKFIVLD